MSEDKKYSAHEAAQIVLAKVGELLQKSEMMKSCHGTFAKVHEKAKEEGYSDKAADKIAGKVKAREMDKTENEVGTEIEKEKKVKKSELNQVAPIQAPNNEIGGNEPWGTAPGTHSNLKLAKFLGHMAAKRNAKVAPTSVAPQAMSPMKIAKPGVQ